jgi:hypothetical protein
MLLVTEDFVAANADVILLSMAGQGNPTKTGKNNEQTLRRSEPTGNLNRSTTAFEFQRDVSG